MRHDGRQTDQLRPVTFTPGFIEFPEGSVLITMGKTRVLCNVTIEESVPTWLENREPAMGWVTAEYALLPRSTQERVDRQKGGFSGRAQEIRRLIGRSLRAAIDLNKLGPRTCIVDCDVLQADGGTRSAAITGGYVALRIALQDLIKQDRISNDVFLSPVAGVSVGMLENQILLDLCYQEDANADADINVVMNQDGEYIEIQGTAEGVSFTQQDLDVMLAYAKSGIKDLIERQMEVLGT